MKHGNSATDILGEEDRGWGKREKWRVGEAGVRERAEGERRERRKGKERKEKRGREGK